MKKAIFGLMLFASIVLVVMFCSNNGIVSPVLDNYDNDELFEVKLVNISNGFATVEVHWLVAKMGRGSNPFSLGPLDAEWTQADLVSLASKTDDGKYFKYTATVQVGVCYDVGGGLSWSGSDIHSSSYRWLTPSEQGGSPYYNPDKKIMSFCVYSNGVVSPGSG